MNLKLSVHAIKKKTISVETAIWQALREMRRNKNNFLVVVQDDSVIGTISKDKLEAAVHFNNGELRNLQELMIKDVIAIEQKKQIREAITWLSENSADHFLLLDNENKVISVISALDLLNFHQCHEQELLEDLDLHKLSIA